MCSFVYFYIVSKNKTTVTNFIIKYLVFYLIIYLLKYCFPKNWAFKGDFFCICYSKCKKNIFGRHQYKGFCGVKRIFYFTFDATR